MTMGGAVPPPRPKKPVRAYKIVKGEKSKNYLDFPSIAECSRFLQKTEEKIFREVNISSICKGKSYSLHGFTFNYIDENGKDIPTNYVSNKDEITHKNFQQSNSIISIPLKFINKNGEIVGYYRSVSNAALLLGITDGTIVRSLERGSFITKGNGKGLMAIKISREEYLSQDIPEKYVHVDYNLIEKINEIYSENHNKIETARILGISKDTVLKYIGRDMNE